jgi:prophage antirepressor-like protein
MATEPWVTAKQVAQLMGVVEDNVYRSRERKCKTGGYHENGLRRGGSQPSTHI